MPGYILSNGIQLNYTIDCFGFATIHSAVMPEIIPDSISIPARIDGCAVDALSDDCFKESPLKRIELPDTLRYIGNDAFFRSKIEQITLPKYLVSLGSWCFAHCYNLKSVAFKDGITLIPNNCFRGCISLKNVRLPKTLDFIAYGAFCGCENLENIIIPKNVDTIAHQAFYSCGLKSISILGNTITFYDDTFSNNSNVIIRCNKNSSIDKEFKWLFPENFIKKYTVAKIDSFLNNIADSENTQEK